MNLGQQQQQQQQRRQHAVHGKVAETFQENHDFLLKIFLGYRMGMRTSSRGKHGWQRRGEGGTVEAAASCAGGFALGSASISQLAVDTFTNFESYIYMTAVLNSR